MKEIENIISAFDEAVKEGKKSALATVVHVEGSSYRRPGARMLITDDGKLTGAISGGCLEGDALRKALLVMAEQRPMVVTYDTTDEDDATLGVGLGCNGIIQILIEPILTISDHQVNILRTLTSTRQHAVLVTLFSLDKTVSAHPGTNLLLLQDETISGTLANHELKEKLIAEAKEAMATQLSSSKTYLHEEKVFTAFIEFIRPPVSLIIVGAGNDAIPLAQTAHILGWKITVADGRPNYATKQRFPDAVRVFVSKAENVPAQLQFDEETALVLMTHNYNYDYAILRQLINRDVTYMGMLGPKKRLDSMLGDLADEGIYLSSQAPSNLFGPVGLDIGAETAEEIAISVIAEIKAVMSGSDGASLKQRKQPIHNPSLTKISRPGLNEIS